MSEMSKVLLVIWPMLITLIISILLMRSCVVNLECVSKCGGKIDCVEACKR